MFYAEIFIADEIAVRKVEKRDHLVARLLRLVLAWRRAAVLRRVAHTITMVDHPGVAADFTMARRQA